MDMSIEQLLFWEGMLADYDTAIKKHEAKIFEARNTIISEQGNIRHLKYKRDLSLTILQQTDPKWEAKLNNYYKQD